jgi:hypothetical protein
MFASLHRREATYKKWNSTNTLAKPHKRVIVANIPKGNVL